jgi:hypothetical protein
MTLVGRVTAGTGNVEAISIISDTTLATATNTNIVFLLDSILKSKPLIPLTELTVLLFSEFIHGKFPFQAQKEEWSENGVLVLLVRFDELGIGKLQEWTENGILIHEQELINLSIDKGKETFWFPSGQLKSRVNHTSGADTVYHEWYESGREKILKIIYFRGNTKVNSNQEWYANGNLKDHLELEKSELVNNFSQRKYL